MAEDSTSLKRRVEELEELHRFAQSLSSIQSVLATLEMICESCLRLCRAERAAVILYGESPGEVVHTLVRSADSTKGEIDHLVNTLIAGWIKLHERPFLAHNLIRELNITQPSSNISQLGPALGVPLVAEGKTIGVVNLVNSRGGVEFTEEELRLASAIAPLATQFIVRARVHQTLFEDNLRLKGELRREHDTSTIIGQSAAMKEAREKIGLVAASQATVLLIGETGTGKELVARAIHFQSSRAEKPFVAVNCAAIPSTLFESELFGHEKGAFTGATATKKGRFELANHGTLFLDEISAMPLDLQPKLLRFLEERTFCRVGSVDELIVDLRIIAATNCNLREAIRKGAFREDLYHRLNVVPIDLPPLRERKEDIPLLAQRFIEEFSAGRQQFTERAIGVLTDMSWKGNVRELRNNVERASILIASKEISEVDLRAAGITSQNNDEPNFQPLLSELIQSNQDESDLTEYLEKQLVELALHRADGNISQASRLLGVERKALERRIEKYGIQKS